AVRRRRMGFGTGDRGQRERQNTDEFLRTCPTGLRKGHVHSDRRAELSGGARSRPTRPRLFDLRADRGWIEERAGRQRPERRHGAGPRVVQLRRGARAADVGARDANPPAARSRRERREGERPQTARRSKAARLLPARVGNATIRGRKAVAWSGFHIVVRVNRTRMTQMRRIIADKSRKDQRQSALSVSSVFY